MADSRGKSPPPKKASPKRSKKPRSSTAKGDLEAKLRQRERQLRELTEQSLHFLDLLQAAREKSEGVEKLEEVPADARRRVRASRSILIPGGRSNATTALDIAVWPSQFGAVESDALGELADQFPTAAVTCICPVADAPKDKRSRRASNLQILAAECSTAAQYWNTAMAATEAPLVLFLAAGTELHQGDIEPLRAIQADPVAMGQPVLVFGEGERTLGLRDMGGYDFERNPVPQDEASLVELDFLAPEAFVLRRDAFHLLGLFDEDLIGHLALVDYCLRAHKQSFRLVGLAEASVTVPNHLDFVTADESTDRDRLVLLARHQPGQVAEALAGTDLFWNLPKEELRGFLQALFVRLPGASEVPDALEILVQEALSMGRSTVPGPMVERYLQGIQEAVESTLELGPADASEHLDDQDPIEAMRQRLDRLRATFEKLRVQVETDKAGNKNLLDRLTTQVEAERVAKKELMDLLQIDRATVDSVQAELDSVRAVRDELTAKLEKERVAHDDVSSELEARQALVARLTGEVEAEREARDLQKAQASEELDRARESQHLLDEGIQLIANALHLPDQRDPAVLAHDAEDLRRELDEGVQLIANALRLPDQRDPAVLAHDAEDLRRELDEVLSNLSERNHWVTLLLQEIARRRLKPFPRKLTEGEKQFLRNQGQDGSI